MSVLGWIALGAAGWLLVAVAVGMAISRAIRLRDRALPHRDDEGAGTAPRRPRPLS